MEQKVELSGQGDLAEKVWERLEQEHPGFIQLMLSQPSEDSGCQLLETFSSEIQGIIRAAYVSAGKPFGPDDNDMWEWGLQVMTGEVERL